MFSLVAHLSGMLMLLGIQPVTQRIAPDFPHCSLSCCPPVSVRADGVEEQRCEDKWRKPELAATGYLDLSVCLRKA